MAKTSRNSRRYRIQMGAMEGESTDYVMIMENNAKLIEDAMNKAIAAALEEIGLAAERFAKRGCPVDTGRLRNSITHALDMDEDAVYIGTNVEYAPYIEVGTSTYGGAHMLEHAATQHVEKYRSILKKHLENG